METNNIPPVAPVGIGMEARVFEVLLQWTSSRMLKEASYTAYTRGIISICLIILDMYARIYVKHKPWCLQCVKWCCVKRDIEGI